MKKKIEIRDVIKYQYNPQQENKLFLTFNRVYSEALNKQQRFNIVRVMITQNSSTSDIFQEDLVYLEYFHFYPPFPL